MTDTLDITIKDVFLMLQDVIKSNTEIKEEIKENRDSLSRQLLELKQEFSKEFQELKTENEELREENKKLKEALNKIERRTKKFNFIVYGLKEDLDGIKDIERIINLFNSTLDVHCAFRDFRDIFRLGNYTEGKNRPVLIEVVTYHLKREILNNSKKLQGSGIFIALDYSTEEYNNRKVLLSSQREARKVNLDAKIRNNNLIIEGTKYSVEDLKTTPRCITDRLEENASVKQIPETEVEVGNCVDGMKNRLEERTGTKRRQETTAVGNKIKRSARINSNNKA